MEEYESPPFNPDGSDATTEEEGTFHILPHPHEGQDNEPANGRLNPSDMGRIDVEEQDYRESDEDARVDEAAEASHDSNKGLTAPEEFTPSMGPDSFDNDRDATSTEFCDHPHDETTPLVQYAIVIDAGSTGSRIHVYKFNNCGPTPALEYETFKAIQPGLSSFARDPTAAAGSLDPLIAEAIRVVPESLRSCTPIEVKATAGLRLTGAKEAQAILDEVRMRLETESPFAVDKAEQAIEIMDGKDEGVYAWITANYLLGKIGQTAPQAETMAVMDLGGASTQIVFEPTFPDESATLADGDHKYELSFGGRDYTLYQHSYLGYGLMRARRSVHNLVAFTWSFLQPGGSENVEWDDLAEHIQVPNPCLAPGTSRKVELDPSGRKTVSVTMTGTESSFESCKRVVELVLAKNAVCEVKPCSFSGVYQPSIIDTFPNGQLLALSYFTDRIQPLLAPFASPSQGAAVDKPQDSEEPISTEMDVSQTKTLTVETLAQMAKEVCAGEVSWEKRWGHDEAAMAELKDRPEYCLDLTFMHGLLNLGESLSTGWSCCCLCHTDASFSVSTGYELRPERELVVEKKLRGAELGWALGAGIALVEKATLTCTA